MNAKSPNYYLTSTPGAESAFERAFQQAASTGTGLVFIGCDFGGDDWSTEVTGEVLNDGTIVIKNINQWCRTLDVAPEHARDEGAES